jgi:hypothetical protein
LENTVEKSSLLSTPHRRELCINCNPGQGFLVKDGGMKSKDQWRCHSKFSKIICQVFRLFLCVIFSSKHFIYLFIYLFYISDSSFFPSILKEDQLHICIKIGIQIWIPRLTSYTISILHLGLAEIFRGFRVYPGHTWIEGKIIWITRSRQYPPSSHCLTQNSVF